MSEPSPHDWTEFVAVEWNDQGGYAYRPDQLLVRGNDAESFVRSIAPDVGVMGLDETISDLLDGVVERGDVQELLASSNVPTEVLEWRTLTGVADATGVLRAARAAGHKVQPNHVVFADNCRCGESCPPHPSLANDLAGLFGNPLRANPLRANPLRANPLRANPLRANPLRANTPPVNSAFPASEPDHVAAVLPEIESAPRTVVFDTGYAEDGFLPPLLIGATISGAREEPDVEPLGGDQYLDPVAGHGTFISGLLQLLSPGTPIIVRRVIQPLGYADELTLSAWLLGQLILDEIAGNTPKWPTTIFSISMSGQLISPAAFLGEVVSLIHTTGITVVASAGNSGSCRPTYPAAFPGVISVGALGPCGPAEFTNYGQWVRACAPGVDLISAFFLGFNGANVAINGVDVDEFDGWAYWSGTSFSVPIVVAALLNDMRLRNRTAKAAVDAIIDSPHLARIPCLGTIVNM